MRGGWAIKREPVDLTVSSLKEHVKIKVVPPTHAFTRLGGGGEGILLR